MAVDIRVGSPTFGRWTGVTLSAENKRQFWVPPGFAHGFVVTGENALFSYKCTNYYAPEYRRVHPVERPGDRDRLAPRRPVPLGQGPQPPRRSTGCRKRGFRDIQESDMSTASLPDLLGGIATKG